MLFTSGAHPADDASYGHPVHRGFAEAINADPVVLQSRLPKIFSGSILEAFYEAVSFSDTQHDIYIAEDSNSLYTAPLIAREHPNSKFIYLSSDHRPFGLGAYSFNNHLFFRKNIKRVDRILDVRLIHWLLSQYVDGVIAVSHLNEDIVRPYVGPSVPIRVAEPFIQEEIYNKLANVSPSLDSKKAITIGTELEYKGLDILTQAWEKIQKWNSEYKLEIIGAGVPDKYERIPGVTVRGYVEDISQVFNQACLYIQPSRVDPHPVTVMEALRAGVPPVVTRTTGSRSIIRSLDSRLVVDPTVNGVFEGTRDYFSMAQDQKQTISSRARKLSDRFNPRTRKNCFRTQFEKIVEITT